MSDKNARMKKRHLKIKKLPFGTWIAKFAARVGLLVNVNVFNESVYVCVLVLSSSDAIIYVLINVSFVNREKLSN